MGIVSVLAICYHCRPHCRGVYRTHHTHRTVEKKLKGCLLLAIATEGGISCEDKTDQGTLWVTWRIFHGIYKGSG